ncbi:helix-turn-helix transcriptional regulator [Streptomyces europaeiscabiei]|uniref:helix-turn-helix domain-containing protein n=1 Tax=Streptomyces europaeiscabiei TaxID=146819 RepID=UPI0029A65B6D|nr:helix-turn-helix transcriptional regulator [Streptomyces europaeiscabiei]MDX3696926.1 helix-turn-helix transcriptional regulator [Streptomyces europaeiscabiei]
MARPEAPVDHTVPALGALAERLRQLRRRAGLSYAELAVRTNYSAAHLKRAASGRILPARPVILAYVGACTGSFGPPELTTLYYLRAVEAVAQAKRDSRRSSVRPKPQRVRDDDDLSGALRDLWAQAGRPESRRMASRWLPRSTANAITTGRTVPRDFRQYLAFLQACGIDDEPQAPWFRAWFKVFGRPSAQNAATTLETLEASYDTLQTYLIVYLEEASPPQEDRQHLVGIVQKYAWESDWTVAPPDVARLIGHATHTPRP